MVDQSFTFLKPLGEGGYGAVHLVDHKRLGIVAYKTCPGDSTEKQAELKVEAEQHRILRHPNVVILYDTIFNSTCCGFFIEYMKYGPVIEFIKRFEVPAEWRIQILYETACGIFYLHKSQPAIIHGDLSSQNILIGEGFHAKIADFGLSRTLKEKYESSTTVTPFRGKPIYIAPEYFKDPRKRKSEKFDVYGFAISAWEILSQKRAYHDFADMRWLSIFVERGERPDMKELDVSIPNTVKQLIEKCWHENENERPGFESIKDQLFGRVSKIQSELRHAYVSLTDQEKMMPLSNGMKTWEITNTVTTTIEDQTPEVRKFTDTTLLKPNVNHASPISELPTPRFRQHLLAPGIVRGIASWGEELYVVTARSPDIEVYDIDTLVHQWKIRVKGLVNAWDMVAHANVLYVSEYNRKLIHRIQLSDETSSNWFVNSKWLTMSMNKKENVVVSCQDLKNKIIEYTPTGSCVREIQVDAIDTIIGGLRHAIQLDNDRFLICHATTTHHRVCIIDSNGRMMTSYGGGPGSGIGQVDFPNYITIDRNGFILVVDYNNNRIIQLKASLEFIREFIPGSAGLEKPASMHLNEHCACVYIEEQIKQTIAIFDL